MVCVTEALSTEKDGVKTGPCAPNSKKGACDLSDSGQKQVRGKVNPGAA